MDFGLQIHLRIIHILLLVQTVVVMVHPARFVRIVYADIYRFSICPLQQLGKRCAEKQTRLSLPENADRFGSSDKPPVPSNRQTWSCSRPEVFSSGQTLHILSNHPLHYRRNQDVIIDLASNSAAPSSVVIVTARPGSYGPTVVVLPEKRPHIIRHLAAVRLDGRLDGISLQHMVHIKECPEITRFYIHSIGKSQSARCGRRATTLMGHHHLERISQSG